MVPGNRTRALELERVGDDACVYVREIAVESRALYFVVQLVFVVLFALGRPAQAIAVPSSVQVYVSLSSLSPPPSRVRFCGSGGGLTGNVLGIAPTLIVIRTGMDMSGARNVPSVTLVPGCT